MKIYSFILISFIGATAFTAPETKEFDSKGLKEISIESISGKVAITTTTGAKAVVIATKNKFPDKCKMTIDRTGDELTVEVAKTGAIFSSVDCDVDFQISVPKLVDLDLSVGKGDITISGIQGELEFKIGSGNLTADGTFQKIDGKSGSGKIAIKGLTGDGELKTGSGDIDLTYSASPAKGELDIKTGSGDAQILFPKGTKIQSNFVAGAGQSSNELGESPNAAFKISMKAGSGSLKIKAY